MNRLEDSYEYDFEKDHSHRCHGLVMVPATMGQPAAETHLPTPLDTLLWAVNHMDRAWFQSQPFRVGPSFKEEAGTEPAIASATPFSQPMERPPEPVEDSKVAVLNSAQVRPGPTPMLTRRSRHDKRNW
jgi:hypothetical protein